MSYLADTDAENPLAPLQVASCTYCIAVGPRAGQKVLSLRTVAGREEKPRNALCADAHGFSLHAAVRFASHQRKELERLCRYITRPALANERLSRNAKGQVVLKLKSPYRVGTTHIVMHPQECMQRLAALVPLPRLHLIRYHGVLTPNAKLLGAVTPQPARKDSAPGHEHVHGKAARMRWARLLKRMFDVDVEPARSHARPSAIIPRVDAVARRRSVGNVLLSPVGPAPAPPGFVTDRPPPPALARACEDWGTEVVVAQ